MSQENVELILGCVAAYNARNLDAWAEFFDPEVEAIPDPTFLESNRVHGRDAYRAWTEQLTHGLVSLWWETTELLDLGPDRVLHGGDWCGRGSASGIETRSNITGVFTIRGEQITRVEFYFDHHDALKAVGLEE